MVNRNYYLKAMQECVNNNDAESAHRNADQLLCNLLDDLGYGDVVDLWREIGKYYV